MIGKAVTAVLGVVAAVALFSLFLSVQKSDSPVNNGQIVVAQEAPAVKIVPANLTGTWRTHPDDVVQWEAVVTENSISVDMVTTDSASAYWRGSFGVIPVGKTGITSVGTDAEFYLSTEKTKDFTYQNNVLRFSFSILGTRSVAELHRA